MQNHHASFSQVGPDCLRKSVTSVIVIHMVHVWYVFLKNWPIQTVCEAEKRTSKSKINCSRVCRPSMKTSSYLRGSRIAAGTSWGENPMCRFLGVLVWFRYLHQCDQWSKVAMENPHFQLDTSSVDCTAYYPPPINRINLGVTLQYMCVYIYIYMAPPRKDRKKR